MKKFLVIVALLAAFAVHAKEKKEFVITYVKSPLNVPSILEKELKLFEKEFAKEGYTFSYPEITAGPDQTQALAAGSVDVANGVGGISVIIACSNGLDIQGKYIFSRAPETFHIITNNPAVKTVGDLKGKKVAGPKGTILHQLLAISLEKDGVKLSQVEHINMNIPNALAALEAKTIDAALLAGPSAAKAVEAGGRVLTTGKGHIEATVMTAVSGKLAKENPDFVNRLENVHKAALKYIEEHPEETWKIVSKETGLTVEQVKEMYKLYNFSSTVTDADMKDLENTQKFLLENVMIKKEISINEMMGIR